MSGETGNVHVWAGADVFVVDDTETGYAPPSDETSPLSAGHNPVGFLSGSDGFVDAESKDTTTHKAWGGIVVASADSNYERRFTFTALEDNLVVYGIVNEGSTVTATKRTVKVPKRTRKPWVVEKTDAAGNKRRRFIHSAKVDSVGDLTENETDPPTRTITLLVFPDADGTLWEEWPGLV